MKPAVMLVLLSASAWAQAPTPAAEPQFGSTCSFPEAALATEEHGTTLISYTGTRAGSIENVKVVHSSGHADLDEAAVQCVSRWRFDPDSATGKFQRGDHATNIAWDPKPTTAGKKPGGYWIGSPHVCDQYYPVAEAMAGIGGTTTLRFTITDEGQVRDIAVDKSSGNENLDAAAVQCASKWRYIPAVEKDKIIAVPWKAEVKWSVNPPTVPAFAEPPPDCLHSYPLKPDDLAGIDGWTELTFTISHGEAEDVVVTHSSGNAALDRAAVECIAKRRYVRDAVIVNGRTVDRYTTKMRERFVWREALKP